MNIDRLIKQAGSITSIDTWLMRILLAVFILLFGFLLRRIFANCIIGFIIQLSKKSKTSFDNLIAGIIDKPARVLIIGISFYLSLSILSLPVVLQHFINSSVRSFFIFIVFWIIFLASENVVLVFERFINKTEKKIDKVLTRFLQKSLKIIILLLGVFMFIREWGYDVSGLIAGLGVGGLAFALAAKDTVSNLFGSITIMLDKAFSIGDWIETDKAEGIVEEIGFRSTKLRTFDQALVSIPNSIMSNEPITNWSRMGKRKVTYTLQIPLDTPHDKIDLLLTRSKEILSNHPDIHHETIVVNVKGFGNSTLDILFYFFTLSTSWVTYLNISEEIILKLLRIFDELDIALIVPAQRLLLEKKTSKKIQNSATTKSPAKI